MNLQMRLEQLTVSTKNFIDKYMSVFNESFPLTKKKVHHQKSNWFDSELKALLIKKKNFLKNSVHRKISSLRQGSTKHEMNIFEQSKLKSKLIMLPYLRNRRMI